MDRKNIEKILEGISDVTVCVIGDICLDAYWDADMKISRLSRETPHYPLPVVSEKYSLGGGGNVIANLAALGIKKVIPVSVTGEDWRAFILRKCMNDAGAGSEYIITDSERVTPCYVKPMRHGISDTVYEDPRLDFENHSPLSAETEEKVLEALCKAAEEADIIAVCDQLACGVITDKIREKICAIAKAKPVVADSRDRIALYENVIVKPNEVEAAGATGFGADEPEKAALALSQKNNAPAIVTLGSLGSVWCENGRAEIVPALKVKPPIDIVGAGDTFLSAFCASYAAGTKGADALRFANTASSVTIRKLGTTGTASPEEMLEAAEE